MGPYDLHFPQGVAVSASNYLYVTDYYNNRVQVYYPNGTYQSTIGMAIQGSGDDQFDQPLGIAINQSGYIFVADNANDRIQIFYPNGTWCEYMGEPGVITVDNSHFDSPTNVFIDSYGNLYVADGGNNRVQVYDNKLQYLATIGGNGRGGANDQFYRPYGITVNSSETVFISDEDNSRIQLYSWPAPTNSNITIAGGAVDTSTKSVQLTLSADNATTMRFSNNGTTYTAWEPFSMYKSWTLDGSPGIKTVYFQTKCVYTETNPVTGSISYTLPPSNLSVSINGGASDTSSPNVTLSLGATGATQMCFSNNGTTYSAWQPYSTTAEWILNGNAGLNTIYFKARNGTIEASAPATATITYVIPPSGLSILINNGAATTTNPSVILTLSANNATEMCFSNNGTTYTAWTAYTTSIVWQLDNSSGIKTVYFNAKNGTVEAVSPVMATITLVSPFNASIAINNGANVTFSPDVTLTLSASYATEMCFSNNGSTYTAWEPYSTTKNWTLSGNLGLNTVYFMVRNSTNVETLPATATIIYGVLEAPVLQSITPNPSTTGNITLQWNAVQYAENYTIFRNGQSFSSVSGSVIILGFTNGTIWRDFITTSGEYYYTVQANNETTTSSLSECQSVVVNITNTSPNPGRNGTNGSGTNPTAPTTPLNLKATPGNRQITLSWQAPSNDGNSAITGYKIYRGTSSGSESYLTTVGNVVNYTDSGLSANITYYYVVSAVNSVGESPKSTEANATTLFSKNNTPNSIDGIPIGAIFSAGLIGVTISVMIMKKRLK